MGYPKGWTDLKKEAITFLSLPSAWLDGSWEENTPCLALGSKNRINRLKCLGNSIVPQIAGGLWLIIMKFLACK